MEWLNFTKKRASTWKNRVWLHLIDSSRSCWASFPGGNDSFPHGNERIPHGNDSLPHRNVARSLVERSLLPELDVLPAIIGKLAGQNHNLSKPHLSQPF